MTFLIRETSTRHRQGYTISIYANGLVHHLPINVDDSVLTLMSSTFTNLIELVHYFSSEPILMKLCLQKPAKNYFDFINERRQYAAQGIHENIVIYKSLSHEISLKINTLRLRKMLTSFEYL